MFDPGFLWLAVLVGAAVLLDLAFGDPRLLPHPVRFLGALATSMEPLLRQAAGQAGDRRKGLRRAGTFGVFFLALGAGAGAWGLSSLPSVGLIFALYLSYAGLALGSLLREGEKVRKRLFGDRDLPAARPALAMLVSRETRDLDSQGVMRGLAETMSENANDGFVAPCFYLVLGCTLGGSMEWGVGALWCYKAVSTLDSLWGYKNDKYRDFGRAAALADDVLAWLPARIAALAMLGTATFERRVDLKDVFPLWRSIKADARLVESPNAGWPMSAAAWLSCAWIGGPAVYFGELKDKPQLGPTQNEWTESRMQILFSLVRSSCIAVAMALTALGTAVLWAQRAWPLF